MTAFERCQWTILLREVDQQEWKLRQEFEEMKRDALTRMVTSLKSEGERR